MSGSLSDGPQRPSPLLFRLLCNPHSYVSVEPYDLPLINRKRNGISRLILVCKRWWLLCCFSSLSRALLCWMKSASILWAAVRRDSHRKEQREAAGQRLVRSWLLPTIAREDLEADPSPAQPSDDRSLCHPRDCSLSATLRQKTQVNCTQIPDS